MNHRIASGHKLLAVFAMTGPPLASVMTSAFRGVGEEDESKKERLQNFQNNEFINGLNVYVISFHLS